jgi:hypothetical protein
MSEQTETAVRLLEEAIDKMRGNLPTEVDEATASKVDETIARIKENREKRKTQKIPEGKYFADPFSKSTYLKDLRDLLIIFKKVVIPWSVKQEMAKLQALTTMMAQASEIDPDELGERLKQVNLAGKGQVETLQEMAKIIGNLAKNG